MRNLFYVAPIYGNLTMMDTSRPRYAWRFIAVLTLCGGCSAGDAPSSGAAAVAPGDVDLGKLPVPGDVKPVYVGPDVAMYVTEAPVDATAAGVKKLLGEKDWEPYGAAGDVQFFKQGLIRLTASVSSAPAQGGKTMISYSREKMSVDLPAPADAAQVHYADSTRTVTFDTPKSRDEIAAYYRTALGKVQWEATTEKPIEIDSKYVLIFRNPTKDMLTLEMYDVQGTNRVSLKHETAEQVAESERRFKEELARREAEKSKPLPQVAIAIPAEAKEIEQKKNRIEFQVAAGTAKAVVEAWRKSLTADGWKEKVITLDDKVGTLSYDRDGQSLSVSYTDVGFMPAEISISAIGAEFTTAGK